jgi:hypothetical protein
LIGAFTTRGLSKPRLRVKLKPLRAGEPGCGVVGAP